MPQHPTVAVPKRWPLLSLAANRGSDQFKDARMINCYAEKDLQEGDYSIQKRPGIAGPVLNLTKPGYGIFHWIKLVNHIDPSTLKQYASEVHYNISIAGESLNLFPQLGTVYAGGSAIGSVVIEEVRAIWRFQPVLDTSGNSLLVFGNGNKTYYTDGSGVFPLSILTNFPFKTVPGFAWLDEVLYVMDLRGNIYGSDIDDITVWPVLNVLTARSEPDPAVALAKQLIYIVALKEWTTQFFYDAGLLEGSALSPVSGANLDYGCTSAQSLQEIDGVLFWLTSNKTASPQVLKLEKLTPTIVSTPAIDRLLDDVTPGETTYSLVLKHAGHKFYILTIPRKNVTMVYDMDQNLWSFWADSSGNYWPYVSLTYGANSVHWIQHESDGNVYQVDADENFPDDVGVAFAVDIYTPIWDGGVGRGKMLTVMEFIADQIEGSELLVRFSDDDYKTWSNFRKIDLSKDRPLARDWGTFKRRAFHFRHKCHTPFRIKAVDFQVDICTL